jgi:hypothetical protein
MSTLNGANFLISFLVITYERTLSSDKKVILRRELFINCLMTLVSIRKSYDTYYTFKILDIRFLTNAHILEKFGWFVKMLSQKKKIRSKCNHQRIMKIIRSFYGSNFNLK